MYKSNRIPIRRRRGHLRPSALFLVKANSSGSNYAIATAILIFAGITLFAGLNFAQHSPIAHQSLSCQIAR